MNEAELRKFLRWFKTETENVWADWQPSLQIGVHEGELQGAGDDWQRGTRWQPLSDEQISALERRWTIQFPWDYRLFLTEVGLPDRPALVERWINQEQIECKEGHRFMNWLADDLEVAYRLNWPTVGLIADSTKPWWWDDAWGAWNATLSPEMAPWQVAEKVMMVTRAAPQPIPLYTHRFLVPRPELPSVCLSIMGSDIIVWSGDIRGALIAACDELLSELPTSVGPALVAEDFQTNDIPFWGRLIG